MTAVTIREATLDEMESLLAFEQGVITAERPFNDRLKPDPIHYYDLPDLITSENATVLVAEANGVLVGSGYAQIRKAKPYMKHDFHSYLGFMYVAPEYRGQGINQQVLKHLTEWSKSQGVHHLVLDVYADNQTAIRAYEKAGFKNDFIEMCMTVE